MKNLSSLRRPLLRGLTLIEVMVSLGIATGLGGVVLTSVVMLVKNTMRLEQTTAVDTQFRNFTETLNSAGEGSDYYLLYSNYAQADKSAKRLLDGRAGDLVVFVYYATPGGSDKTVARLVGLYRDFGKTDQPLPAEPKLTIRRFDSSVDNWGVVFPTSAYTDIEDILPGTLGVDISTFTSLVDAASGGVQDNGYMRLFLNQRNRSVGVFGSFLSASNSNGVTSAYNFTLTPKN